MIYYIAYPTSLTLQSANALQTYTTLRELRRLRPDTVALIPRWGREPSRFSEVGATHLLRPALGKLSRLHKSTLLYYLEHSAFALMTAAHIAPRRHQVEAVYVRQVVCAAWWAGLLGPALGVPVIYEAHDFETRNPSRAKEPWVRGLLHLLDRVAIGRSSAVVSLTEDFRRLLAQIGLRDPAEVAVIPDAYDQELFALQDRAACRAALGIPDVAPLIAYAGMTFAHRWLDGLLAAVDRLRGEYPQLIVLLAGGRTAEIAVLMQQARALGLAVADWRGQEMGDGRRETGDGRRETGDGRRETGDARKERSASRNNGSGVQPLMIFTGPRPQAEVVQLLGAADVLAIPDTVTDVTASPLKLFEYLSLGQPLVLPRIPALHEIVPETLSYSFARQDLAGLVEALRAALNAVPDTIKAAERRRIAAEHTYARRALRIVDLVETLTEEHAVKRDG